MKVYSPNKEYTGISASVPFCNGTGETDDPHLIEWFKEHGYTVEEPMKAEVPMEEAVVEVQTETPAPKGKRGKA
jgi:hypothetical protein